jgi:hypothetical protein
MSNATSNRPGLTVAAAVTAVTAAFTPAPALAQAESAREAEPADAPLAVVERAPERETDTLAPRARRRHGRMALETAAVLAVGASWYWRDNGKPNEVDWQLPWDARALGAKIGFGSSGWRFDGNPFEINALGHPGFGALTHFLARKNGYSLAESFLVSTVASGAWELLIEWAEYGSINDMLSTSTTGIPVGETGYQLITNWRRARFGVATGAGIQNGDTIATLGVRGELNMIPATGTGTISGGRKVSFAAEVPFDGAARTYEGGAKTSLYGYYHNGPRHSLFAGASAEFYYRDQKERPNRDWDLLSFTAAGPTLDLQLRGHGATLDIGADLYADFAMVKSQAFAAWRAENPTEIVRNSMQDKDRPYYYGYGFSANPRLNVAYRGVNVGGKLAISRFGSIEGHDRDQEMLTADVHMVDRDTTAEAWAGYAHDRLSVVVDSRLRERSGTAGGVRGEASERTTMLTVAYRH